MHGNSSVPVYISVYSNKCLVISIILNMIGNLLSIAQKHNRLGLSVRITEGSDNGDSRFHCIDICCKMKYNFYTNLVAI